jgi:APA family basic amino acid/polyamine antiporter
MLPVEGSAYAYSYATMGELFAWIIGWDLILEYSMASASVAVGWSGYFGKLLGLFGIHLPLYLMHDLHTAGSLLAEATQRGELATFAGHYSSIDIPMILGFPFALNLPAFLIIIAVTTILVIGIREAAGSNLLMVLLKVVVILFIIVVGFFYVDVANWTPFIPPSRTGEDGVTHYGWM